MKIIIEQLRGSFSGKLIADGTTILEVLAPTEQAVVDICRHAMHLHLCFEKQQYVGPTREYDA